jgi:cell division protein FtsW (lipid II flippase)
MRETPIYERDLGSISAEREVLGPLFLLPIAPIALLVAGLPWSWVLGITIVLATLAAWGLVHRLRKPHRVTIRQQDVILELPFRKVIIPHNTLSVTWCWLSGTFTGVNLKVQDLRTKRTYIFNEEFPDFVALGRTLEGLTA